MLFGFLVQWLTAVQKKIRLSNWHSAYCTATYSTCLLVTVHTGPRQWENLATPLQSFISSDAIALKLSQCMVALFITACVVAYISKPELHHGKMILVTEKSAVFTPYSVIFITVTTITGVCAWVGHPTCALTTDRCSTPVRHLNRITWHPPGCSIFEHLWTITLILDKLLTVWGNSGETRQLGQTRSCVMNVTCVTSWRFASIHQCSAFTVVTDDCHATSTLVTHVTRDVKR